MQTQHLLLLSSLALSNAAPAEEPKPGANTNGKPAVVEAARADAAKGTAASDELIPIHPAPKNRVRQTFAPSAKRM